MSRRSEATSSLRCDRGADAAHVQEEITRPSAQRDARYLVSETGICRGCAGERSRCHEIEVALVVEETTAGASHHSAENLLGDTVHLRQVAVQFHRKLSC